MSETNGHVDPEDSTEDVHVATALVNSIIILYIFLIMLLVQFYFKESVGVFKAEKEPLSF